MATFTQSHICHICVAFLISSLASSLFPLSHIFLLPVLPINVISFLSYPSPLLNGHVHIYTFVTSALLPLFLLSSLHFSLCLIFLVSFLFICLISFLLYPHSLLNGRVHIPSLYICHIRVAFTRFSFLHFSLSLTFRPLLFSLSSLRGSKLVCPGSHARLISLSPARALLGFLFLFDG